MKRILAAAGFVLAAAAMVFAGAAGTDWLRPSAVADHEAVPQGATLRIAVVLDIDPGYHLYANPPSSPDLLPVVVEPQPVSHIRWGAVRYPPGEPLTPNTPIGQSVSVYTGRTLVLVEAAVADDAPVGEMRLPLALSYQGCSEETCYPPASRDLAATVRIVAKSGAAVPANADIFAEADSHLPLAPPQATAVEGAIDLAATFEHSFLLYLGALLLIGLALNLTPCVFPLIPVTMTLFAQQGESRASRVLPLAVLYVLGLAATFTLVGVLAALAGKSMGVVLTQPAGVLAVVIVLAVMMASTFGAFEIRLPSGLMGKLGGRRGLFGAAFMGMVMGAVAAPCVGPLLFALIALIAAKQSVALGAVSFFIVGLGLGLPFLVLGLFTSQINRFPRSGGWLVWVKQIMGLAIGGLILYFVQRFIDPAFFRALVLAYCLFAAVYLGFLEGLSRRPFSRTFLAVRLVAFAAVLAGTVGGYLYATQERPEVKWTAWHPGALEAAKAEGRPVLLYFGADWCIACKEWHAGVFSDPGAIKAAEPFARIVADVTKPEGDLKFFAERFEGVNPPLVIIFGPDGRMLKSYRSQPTVEEFVKVLREAVPPADMTRLMSEASSRGGSGDMELLIFALGDERNVGREAMIPGELPMWDWLNRYRPSVGVRVRDVAQYHLEQNARKAARPLARHIHDFAREHGNGGERWAAKEFDSLRICLEVLIEVANVPQRESQVIPDVPLVTEYEYFDPLIIDKHGVQIARTIKCTYILGYVSDPGNLLGPYRAANGEVRVTRRNLDSLADALASFVK